MTHLPGIPSNGMPYSLCGKSKITFVPTEWIASDWQQATGQISCAKCLRFRANMDIDTSSHPYCPIACLMHNVAPGTAAQMNWVPSRLEFVCPNCQAHATMEWIKENYCEVESNPKGGENQMEEMKKTIRRWHLWLTVGSIYTVASVDTAARCYDETKGTCVLLKTGGYIESPTAKREDSIERSFRVVVVRSDDVYGGTMDIVEVVKDSAGNWVEKVMPGVGAEVPKPVTNYKRVIQHFNASAYQEPDIVGVWRSSARAIGDVFLVVPGRVGNSILIQVVKNTGTKMTNYIESPYANPADAVGKAFKVIAGDSTTWTIEEVPVDQVGRAKDAGVAAIVSATVSLGDHFSIKHSSTNTAPSTIVKEQIMVFQGIVVREKTVPAGEGVTTGVKKSEVIYVTDKPVVAADTGAAKAIILARAIVAVKDLDVEDTTKPVTVQALQYSNI